MLGCAPHIPQLKLDSDDTHTIDDYDRALTAVVNAEMRRNPNSIVCVSHWIISGHEHPGIYEPGQIFLKVFAATPAVRPWSRCSEFMDRFNEVEVMLLMVAIHFRGERAGEAIAEQKAQVPPDVSYCHTPGNRYALKWSDGAWVAGPP